jgi:hypothetical protein
MDWSHVKKRGGGNTTLLWNPQVSRKRRRPKNSWRRSVIKETGRSWNELRFLAADRSGKNSWTIYVPKGTMDSIIIIMCIPS